MAQPVFDANRDGGVRAAYCCSLSAHLGVHRHLFWSVSEVVVVDGLGGCLLSGEAGIGLAALVFPSASY